MNEYDKLFSTIETIGSTNPIADENGALTVAPTHKITPGVVLDAKMIAESKSKKNEYDLFFGAVDSVNSGSEPKNNQSTNTGKEFALGKAKAVLSEAVDLMNEKSIEYWTSDKNIIDACNKLRPILDKIVKRL